MQMELRAALLCLGLCVSACSGGGGGGLDGGKGAVGNLAPSISGTPPAVAVVGEFYSFTPAAQDPEGRPVSFTIRNKPPWAKFRHSDGRISGTPEPSQIGSHIEIEIAASDGSMAAALPVFTIDVFGRGDGSATLSWHPPTQNEDGSSLTGLTGYRIHFGRHKRNLNRTIVLDNPGLTRYMIEGLTPAHWHFAMTSVNREGVESSRSRTVSKKIG